MARQRDPVNVVHRAPIVPQMFRRGRPTAMIRRSQRCEPVTSADCDGLAAAQWSAACRRPRRGRPRCTRDDRRGLQQRHAGQRDRRRRRCARLPGVGVGIGRGVRRPVPARRSPSGRRRSSKTAVHTSCEALSSSSVDAVDAVNAYVDAYNNNAPDIGGASPGPRSTRSIAALTWCRAACPTPLSPELTTALNGWVDAARALAAADFARTRRWTSSTPRSAG